MFQFGWVNNPELLAKAHAEAPDSAKLRFQLAGVTAVRRLAMFEVARKVLGHDISNVPQPVGNCVGASTKREIEYLQCMQIAMGNLAEFHYIFDPYHYGAGRVYIGHQRDHQDGSLGLWQSQALVKYGVIALDTPGLPEYNAQSVRSWGANDGGVLDSHRDLGQQHLVQKAAKVSSWEDCVNAVANGYPVEVCSNQGFEMLAGSDGFHHPKGSWPHSMSIIFVDDEGEGIPSHGGILNNWGSSSSVHGIITDFRDKSLQWPGGMLRVRAEVIDKMLKQDDSYTYSSLQDFPAQALPPEFFSGF
jgi:hypothetical protein